MTKLAELIENEYLVKSKAQKENYELRLKVLEEGIEQKKAELAQFKNDFKTAPKKKKLEYSIEKKFNGFRAVLSKKGGEVKIFSDQAKDITSAFPTVAEQARGLANADFIVDSEMVPYENGKPLGRDIASRFIGSVQSGKKLDDSQIIFHVFDCVYYGRDIANQPLFERKKVLHSMKFSDNIKEVGYVVVDNKADAIKAVSMFSDMKGSEGALVKKYEGVYAVGKESDDWIKYRSLMPFSVMVLKANQVAGESKGRNYSIGIKLSDNEAEKIDMRYISKYSGDLVEMLGNTFNTSVVAAEGDIIDIRVEEVWRHEYKDGSFRFSLHKPHVESKSDKKETSSISDLDAAVVSRGVAVKEFEQEMASEGTEVETKNFPSRMQQYFNLVKKAGKLMPFVIQWHYRGHEISQDERSKENIPEKYLYKLDSIHADFRMSVGNHLEGITMLSPTTSDPSIEDKIFAGKLKHVRGVVKLPQPKQWLTVEGYMKRGEPGTTTKSPAFFVIIAKGTYLPLVIEDHRIIMKVESDSGSVDMNESEQEKNGIYITRKPGLSLRQLPKYVEFHIAHIGERWIVLVDELDKYEENH